MKPYFERGGLRLFNADCSSVGDVLTENSVDAIVTDPPAGIGFMGKAWDSDKGGREAWIAWLAGVMGAASRALRPGGHALVWAIPRTSHWTATALEEAGFEIRDVVVHLFGTGFPKSLDVSKAIDAAAGAEREVCGRYQPPNGKPWNLENDESTPAVGPVGHSDRAASLARTAPATEAARQWQGWGTALKPAAEHWILARKPLAGTVAANVQTWGTGALNIGGCRIATTENLNGGAYSGGVRPTSAMGCTGEAGGKSSILEAGGGRLDPGQFHQPAGRWPANVTLDEEAAALLDAQSGTLQSGAHSANEIRHTSKTKNAFGGRAADPIGERSADSGGASRFFYCAKPSRAERDAGCEHLPERTGGEATDREDGSAGTQSPRSGAGRTGGARNFHPTVKSIALMRWLCRLITPPGGLVLDLFAGSGTTGCACALEGLRFIGFEREAEYAQIAAARISRAVTDAEAESKLAASQLDLFRARSA